MGINGLLPLLKSIHKPCNLKKFQGKTLGVDAYGWLHRGTVACAMELAMGKPTRKFVEFSMHRVRMLQHFGVIPFLIFDGDYLPSKSATEVDRAKRREESKRTGFELLNAGKTAQAYNEFQKAVDVTPEMARQLIDELKKAGVQYIVAPYEADAQMVYLERKGIIDGIISEDSDLLVFGAKCLLTKLDQYGNCIEINKADFCACREISLTGWSDAEFRRMAILSGCDYLASINNMGLKTAYRMVRKHKTIEKVIRMLQFDGKFHVPKGYLEAFYQAELTFLHQRVFCPDTLRLVLHTEPEHLIDESKMPFIGAYVEPEIAQGVAKGDLNPMTKLPIVVASSKNMVIATTPKLFSHSKPQKSTPSNDLKKGTPIDTFFKKRTPLAELDINCFVPSPSQQEALRRNSGPWMATPVTRPYITRPIIQPDQIPQPEPPPSRHQSVQGRNRTPTISEPRPPKRARLCADIDNAVSPSRKTELGPSRFFGSALPDPSPSLKRNIRSKRSKQQEINIFSDDSIEEALMALPDAGVSSNNWPKLGKNKIPIFEEKVADQQNETRASLYPKQIVTKKDLATARNTPSMSSASSVEKPAIQVETTPIPSSAPTLKDKFAFSATPLSTKNVSRHIGDLPTPKSSASSRQSKIPLAVKSSHPLPNKSTSRNTGLTPLQRLAASATNRRNLPMTPPITPTLDIKTKSSFQPLKSKACVPFPEVVPELKMKEVDPGSVPLPIPDEAEIFALGAQNGSEDLIIHDSESEGEALSPRAQDENTPNIQIDFSDFVYARLA